MPLRNTAEAYGSLAKFLHWAIVLLIVPQFFLAEAADELPNGIEKLKSSTGTSRSACWSCCWPWCASAGKS